MAIQTLLGTRVIMAQEMPSGAIFIRDGSDVLKVSTDDGGTFNTVSGSGAFVTGTLAQNSLGELLVGTTLASPTVYYCTPTGVTASTGLSGAAERINCFTHDDGSNPIYACSGTGSWVHKSTDHGHTWTNISTTFPITQPASRYFAIESAPMGLLMGGEIGGILLSTDGGNNWTDYGLFRNSVRLPTDYNGNLWFIQTSPYTSTVLASVGDPDVPGLGKVQCHRTGDGSSVWHGVTGMHGASGEEAAGGYVFQADGSIWAGGVLVTPDTGEVYRSTNDGASWTEISSTLGKTFSGNTHISLGPSGRTYITDKNGLYRTYLASGNSNSMFFGGGV